MRLVITFLVLCNIGLCQDWVRLGDRSRILGEIVHHDDKTVAIIDRLGVKHELAASDVIDHKKGRALAKSLAKKVDGLEVGDVEGLFAVAAEALARKSQKSDGKRLMRRVLALEADHAEARAALGHVRALDRWYPDEKKAARAVTAHFKERGFVLHEGGWIEADALPRIESAPADWMIEGMVWRLVEDVMTERGLVRFRDDWLAPSESEFVRYATVIEDESGLFLDGAQFQSVVVIHFKGRKEAQVLAKQLFEARRWYAEFYDDPQSVTEPLQIEVIVETFKDFERFRETVGGEFGASNVTEGRADREGGMLSGVGFSPFLGGLHHVELPSMPDLPGGGGFSGGVIPGGDLSLEALPHSMIFGMAHRQTVKTWGGDLRRLPYFLAHANAVHAEVAALGKTMVQEATIDTEYGRTSENEFHGNRGADLKQMRVRLRATLKKRTMSVRSLFFASGVQMDSGLDQFGVVFLEWLREEHAPKLVEYTRDTDRLETVDARFERIFGMSFEKAEKAFRSWLG